ncbi:MAG: ABC transporter ATP-binding protein, partial [Candidatus Saccharibacteria bacterium]
ARLADNLTNMSNIKYFAREKYETKQFNRITQKLADSQYWDWGIGEIIFAWQGLLAIVFEIVVFWLSLYLVANHKIDLGQLVLVQLYTGNVIYNLWNVPRMVRRVESAFADSAEMTEILYTEPEITDTPDALVCSIKDGSINFEDVSFCHKDALDNDPLFRNVNLDVKAGEKVGLAGPSGGGKTTLTKILLRLADIDAGQITIDGQNIAKLKQTDLRQAITYVPQEPILFHRSLLDNIRYGKPSASTQEIIEAAKRAHADDFINKLPEGYNTMVGERGVKLSGGQRQRVAIARAMLKNSPILVLDEATSALDSESEKLIQDALWKLMQGRTAIVVAHRLSTIQKLDRIIVLDGGNITEQGTHQTLLDKNGTYAKLWAHQSGGFIED